jgi:hypothetical protein
MHLITHITPNQCLPYHIQLLLHKQDFDVTASTLTHPHPAIYIVVNIEFADE